LRETTILQLDSKSNINPTLTSYALSHLVVKSHAIAHFLYF